MTLLVALLANLTIAIATVLQRSSGLGFSLVAVPILALLVPRSVPASLLILTLPINLIMMRRERERNWFALRWMLGGRIVGTLAAFSVLSLVPESLMTVLVGLTIIALVAAALSPRHRVTIRTCLGVGIFSGISGTIAASGGTPMALLLSRHRGPELRGSIAPVLAVGMVMSLVALGLAGQLDAGHFGIAGLLAPGMLLGLIGGEAFAPLLDRWSAVRPLVLALGLLGGISVLILGMS